MTNFFFNALLYQGKFQAWSILIEWISKRFLGMYTFVSFMTNDIPVRHFYNKNFGHYTDPITFDYF